MIVKMDVDFNLPGARLNSRWCTCSSTGGDGDTNSYYHDDTFVSKATYAVGCCWAPPPPDKDLPNPCDAGDNL